MTYVHTDPMIRRAVLAIATRELHRATSESDLKKRLANLGYGVRFGRQGRILFTLPQRVELGVLPAP